MILVNFSHPLTELQRGAIEGLTGCEVAETRDVATHFDHAQPFAGQAEALVEAAGLAPEQWQTESLLINLPSLHVIAALVLAELHGRMGYFPAVLRLRPVSGSVPPQFEVAEILNLQAVRDAARERR
jgi:hypothetical protein